MIITLYESIFPFCCTNASIIKEYGMALINESRNIEAIHVLSKVHDKELSSKYFTSRIDSKNSDRFAEITSTSSSLRTRFKLVTAMSNAGKCDSARPLIDEGLGWIDSIETSLDEFDRNDEAYKNFASLSSMKHANLDNKAYFLIAKSRCSKDVASMASTAYEAAVTRPQMEYALNYAQSVIKIVEQVQTSGLDPQKVLTSWQLENESDQIAKLSFSLKQ